MNAISKIALYANAAWATKSLNWRGLPIIPKSFLSTPPHNRGAYNEFLLWLHKLQLNDVKCVLDVGANWGDFSQAAQFTYTPDQIILFEPLPNLLVPLKKLASRYQTRWTIEPIALGSSRTEMALHVSETDDTIGSLIGFSSNYLAANTGVNKTTSITCQVVPLDEIFREKQLSQIDLLKIDVEGFEFEVLAGAKQALDKTRAVVIEVSLIRTAQKDPLNALFSLLQSHDFSIVDVIPSFHDPKMPWKPVEFNVLARK